MLIIKYSDVTVEVYTLSLKECTKLKGLLEVISSSAEFETIPIRRHEESLDQNVGSVVKVSPYPTPLERTSATDPWRRVR